MFFRRLLVIFAASNPADVAGFNNLLPDCHSFRSLVERIARHSDPGSVRITAGACLFKFI
jgi:hypothetical protein